MMNVRDLGINVLPGEGLHVPVYPQYLDTRWGGRDDDKGGSKGSKGSSKGSKGSSKSSSKSSSSKTGSKKK